MGDSFPLEYQDKTSLIKDIRKLNYNYRLPKAVLGTFSNRIVIVTCKTQEGYEEIEGRLNASPDFPSVFSPSSYFMIVNLESKQRFIRKYSSVIKFLVNQRPEASTFRNRKKNLEEKIREL